MKIGNLGAGLVAQTIAAKLSEINQLPAFSPGSIASISLRFIA